MILGALSMLVVVMAVSLCSVSSVCVFMVWCGYEIGGSDNKKQKPRKGHKTLHQMWY